MSAAIASTFGRAAAEALMVDQCLIRRRTGETTDPFSGTITPTWTTIYTGKCKVAEGEAQGRVEDAGQQFMVMKMRELHLPIVGSEGVRRDDEAALTVATDADMLGRTFFVRDIAGKTHTTARRLTIQERA